MSGTEGAGADRAAAPGPVGEVRHWLQRHGVDVGSVLERDTDTPETDTPDTGTPRTATPDTGRPVVDDDDPDADAQEVARRIVLRKLEAQARTRTELARALRAKSVPEEVATVVLDRMSEVGLVDDAAFAQDWVSSRQQRRHLSRSALRRELQTKGVARDEIEQALTGVGSAEEYDAAVSLARRRQATMASLPREVQYRRLAGVLARRGFGGSVAGQVIGEVLGGVDIGAGADDPDQ